MKIAIHSATTRATGIALEEGEPPEDGEGGGGEGGGEGEGEKKVLRGQASGGLRMGCIG